MPKDDKVLHKFQFTKLKLMYRYPNWIGLSASLQVTTTTNHKFLYMARVKGTNLSALTHN